VSPIEEVLRLARLHVADGAIMETSARLCLADAVKLADDGRLVRAADRAVDSLAYSVGILHSDYRRCVKLTKRLKEQYGE
jgi:hypothetical protein